jgi:dihydropteroate synthase type 2
VRPPGLLGILNVTEDSFSDGNRFLEPAAAIAQANKLARDGAAILDVGAAASNPDAKPVPPDVEIARFAALLPALRELGVAVSLDTFSPVVQRWALGQGVDYLNDIKGFPDPGLYDALAASPVRLIVMHAVQDGGRAERIAVEPAEIMDRILAFFDKRVAALTRAGVDRSRLVLDPGMGLFLGTRAAASFRVLRELGTLKQAFGLPVLVSVSRKSFLRRLADRPPREAGALTLAAELFAARQGADFIRTHDPAALKDGLLVEQALTPQ